MSPPGYVPVACAGPQRRALIEVLRGQAATSPATI